MNTVIHNLIREKCRSIESSENEDLDIESRLLLAADDSTESVIETLLNIVIEKCEEAKILEGAVYKAERGGQ